MTCTVATTTPALVLDKVSVHYGTHVAMDHVSATIPRARFTAVIGPNGCGKSTLLRSVVQMTPLASGKIEVLGRDTNRSTRRQLARSVSLLPQQISTPAGITVAELVQRGRHPYHGLLSTRAVGDREAVERAVELAGVADLLPRRVNELSGGQRQRAWLAMVLAQDTEVVLLDEPTTYLDLAAQYHLLDLCAELVEQGRTVVAVLHDLPQAVSYADHLLLMQHGRLVADGTARQVITEEQVSRVYGIDCHVDLDSPRSPVVAPRTRAERQRSGDVGR